MPSVRLQGLKSSARGVRLGIWMASSEVQTLARRYEKARREVRSSGVRAIIPA
jgi:hypothetical protein